MHKIQELIQVKDIIPAEEDAIQLKLLISEYPWFSSPYLLLARHIKEYGNQEALQHSLPIFACYAGNRAELYRYVHSVPEEEIEIITNNTPQIQGEISDVTHDAEIIHVLARSQTFNTVEEEVAEHKIISEDSPEIEVAAEEEDQIIIDELQTIEEEDFKSEIVTEEEPKHEIEIIADDSSQIQEDISDVTNDTEIIQALSPSQIFNTTEQEVAEPEIINKDSPGIEVAAEVEDQIIIDELQTIEEEDFKSEIVTEEVPEIEESVASSNKSETIGSEIVEELHQDEEEVAEPEMIITEEPEFEETNEEVIFSEPILIDNEVLENETLSEEPNRIEIIPETVNENIHEKPTVIQLEERVKTDTEKKITSSSADNIELEEPKTSEKEENFGSRQENFEKNKRGNLENIVEQEIPESIVKAEVEEQPSHSFSDWLNLYNHEGNQKIEKIDPHQTPLKSVKIRSGVLKTNNVDAKFIIDKFIKEEPRIRPKQIKFFKAEDVAEKSVKEDFTLATETLANIYIKQGLLEKAIEIFNLLALRYPQKSGYFAVKIKELKNNEEC